MTLKKVNAITASDSVVNLLNPVDPNKLHIVKGNLENDNVLEQETVRSVSNKTLDLKAVEDVAASCVNKETVSLMETPQCVDSVVNTNCGLRETAWCCAQLNTAKWRGLVIATGEMSLSKVVQCLLLALAI